MNLYSNQTLTQRRHTFNLSSLFWMIVPLEKPLHYEDLIGDVEEAYADDQPIRLSESLATHDATAPAYDTNQFERDYRWFLS